MKLKFTKFQIMLEILSLAVLIGMVVHVALLWGGAPDTVPMHYGADGTADRFDGKSAMVMLPIMAAILFGGLTLIEFIPSAWNVLRVHKGREEEMYRATRTMMILLKTEVVATFWYMAAMILLGQQLGPAFLPLTLAVVFGTLVVYIVLVVRMKKEKPAKPE